MFLASLPFGAFVNRFRFINLRLPFLDLFYRMLFGIDIGEQFSVLFCQNWNILRDKTDYDASRQSKHDSTNKRFSDENQNQM